MKQQQLRKSFLKNYHQTPKWRDRAFKNNMCCGIFDLVIGSALLNNEFPNEASVRRRVTQLVKWGTQHDYMNGHYTKVGEFFDAQTFKAFIDGISNARLQDNQGYEEVIYYLRELDTAIETFNSEEELASKLEKLSMNQLIIFPYEPAYDMFEGKQHEKNGDHFLHFGLVLPNAKRKKYYRVIQTSRGREVRKPNFTLFMFNHFAQPKHLFKQNMKPRGFGYKWQLQFPWKKYAGDHEENFSVKTVPKYQEFNVSGQMLVLTKKGEKNA